MSDGSGGSWTGSGRKAGLCEQDILELPTVRRFKIDVRFTFPGIPVKEGSNGSD